MRLFVERAPLLPYPSSCGRIANRKRSMMSMQRGMANSQRFSTKLEDEGMELTTFAAARIFDANPVVLQRLVLKADWKQERTKTDIGRSTARVWNIELNNSFAFCRASFRL
jgi:hypothetical protein